MVTHVLFETASGYAVFKAKLHEDIGATTISAQDSIKDFSKFSKMVELMSFSPFKSAAQALENANDVSEGHSSYCLFTLNMIFKTWFHVRNRQ
jgi:nucleolar protein 56